MARFVCWLRGHRMQSAALIAGIGPGSTYWTVTPYQADVKCCERCGLIVQVPQ